MSSTSRSKTKLLLFPHELCKLHPSTSSSSSAAAAFDGWTLLPEDMILHLLSFLAPRERAALSATCTLFRRLSLCPTLWSSLDLRPFALSPSSYFPFDLSPLRRLRFRCPETAAALPSLPAPNLLHLSATGCHPLTDPVFSALVASYPLLETLDIEHCLKMTGVSLRCLAASCPNLRSLRLSALQKIDHPSVLALDAQCSQLEELAFLDSWSVYKGGFQEIGFRSLKFLSMAGSCVLNWEMMTVSLRGLPNLVGVDVSRTDIDHVALLRLLSPSSTLKVVCALRCTLINEEIVNDLIPISYDNGPILLSDLTDIAKGIDSLFENNEEIKNWLEWSLTHALLRIAEREDSDMEEFWMQQGAALLVRMMKSLQEDVQERAATAIATFLVADGRVKSGKAKAVMDEGGIPMLLDLARTCREDAQCQAAKALATLAVITAVAKEIVDKRGIPILVSLVGSKNRWVAEEAAEGLWNLSVDDGHKEDILEAGGVKALLDLISRSSAIDGVLERATGALANLATDDRCSMEITMLGGVKVMAMLVGSYTHIGVQKQSARALAHLATNGDNNCNNVVAGQAAGAIEALVQLLSSPSECVRQEAAGALWNLSSHEGNQELIAASGGVETLVTLVKHCSVASRRSRGLQEKVAGALWGLSESEASCIAIGRQGGIPPLIALARSYDEDVRETAVGALWNLVSDAGNARLIVENEGVPALAHICSHSRSKLARMMAALALSRIFDGRMDEAASVGSSSHQLMALKHIAAFLMTCSTSKAYSEVAGSSNPTSLSPIVEAIQIPEAGNIICSATEIGRLVAMLRGPSPILRGCASFALLQFTFPGGRHSAHHAKLLRTDGVSRILCAAAACLRSPLNYQVFERLLLRILDNNQTDKAS